MNAEFTEKKIVITTETVDGTTVTTVTPAKVRKGLDTKAFVGAMFCWSGGSSLIVGAATVGKKIQLMPAAAGGTIKLEYDPATGEFTYTPANSNPGH